MTQTEKGFFSSSFEKWLADQLDDAYTFKNIFVEGIDGKAYHIVIKSADNGLADKIKWDHKAEVRNALDQVKTFIEEGTEEALEGATKLFAETLDSFIDIPLLDDETEKAGFELLGSMLKLGIMAIIKKKKGELE